MKQIVIGIIIFLAVFSTTYADNGDVVGNCEETGVELPEFFYVQEDSELTMYGTRPSTGEVVEGSRVYFDNMLPNGEPIDWSEFAVSSDFTVAALQTTETGSQLFIATSSDEYTGWSFTQDNPYASPVFLVTGSWVFSTIITPSSIMIENNTLSKIYIRADGNVVYLISEHDDSYQIWSIGKLENNVVFSTRYQSQENESIIDFELDINEDLFVLGRSNHEYFVDGPEGRIEFSSSEEFTDIFIIEDGEIYLNSQNSVYRLATNGSLNLETHGQIDDIYQNVIAVSYDESTYFINSSSGSTCQLEIDGKVIFPS